MSGFFENIKTLFLSNSLILSGECGETLSNFIFTKLEKKSNWRAVSIYNTVYSEILFRTIFDKILDFLYLKTLPPNQIIESAMIFLRYN